MPRTILAQNLHNEVMNMSNLDGSVIAEYKPVDSEDSVAPSFFSGRVKGFKMDRSRSVLTYKLSPCIMTSSDIGALEVKKMVGLYEAGLSGLNDEDLTGHFADSVRREANSAHAKYLSSSRRNDQGSAKNMYTKLQRLNDLRDSLIRVSNVESRVFCKESAPGYIEVYA